MYSDLELIARVKNQEINFNHLLDMQGCELRTLQLTFDPTFPQVEPKVNLDFGDFTLSVAFKKIRSLRLAVRHDGSVRVSAPRHTEIESVHAFVAVHLAWVRSKRAQALANPRCAPPARVRFVDGETHRVWGEQVTLRVVELNKPPKVHLEGSELKMYVRPGTKQAMRKLILEKWYIAQTRIEAAHYFEHWTRVMGTYFNKLAVQHMKTRWGTCNPRNRTIRLNSELARRPKSALDYVVMHELVHLFEANHGPRFKALSTRFMPDWRLRRAALKTQ